MPRVFVVRECADSTVWIYLCCPGSEAAGGYCGALGRRRVNSSLTPIHYGPLLPPSRSAALRHSQAPAFTHNVNHSGRALQHRGGAEPADFLVGNPTCVCFFPFFFFFLCLKCESTSHGTAQAFEGYNEAIKLKMIADRQKAEYRLICVR